MNEFAGIMSNVDIHNLYKLSIKLKERESSLINLSNTLSNCIRICINTHKRLTKEIGELELLKKQIRICLGEIDVGNIKTDDTKG